jgi:hypothetical protein
MSSHLARRHFGSGRSQVTTTILVSLWGVSCGGYKHAAAADASDQDQSQPRSTRDAEELGPLHGPLAAHRGLLHPGSLRTIRVVLTVNVWAGLRSMKTGEPNISVKWGVRNAACGMHRGQPFCLNSCRSLARYRLDIGFKSQSFSQVGTHDRDIKPSSMCRTGQRSPRIHARADGPKS